MSFRTNIQNFAGLLIVAVSLLPAALQSQDFEEELLEGQVPVPELRARVNDYADILPADEESALESKLAALEQEKGSQIVILTVPTTGIESIEQYSIRVAETWQIGRKGVDDGVILLIAPEDRELRIEVGYGLEGAIPDATANRIIDEFITPRFKEGDFPGGVHAGIDRLIGLVRGEPLPEPEEPLISNSAKETISTISLVGVIIILGFILRVTVGGGWGFIITAGIHSLIALIILQSFAELMTGVIIAIGVSFGRGGSGGGYSSSGGGSFGGGGGFSGGGGSFGGGGASGSW